MKGVLGILILLSLSQIVVSDKLKLSVEFCRHGARAPISYPFDEEVLGPFPVGPGNLTPGGMRMHGLVGSQLRTDLIHRSHLLSESYNLNEMLVVADNCNRTIQSAQSQMYGLYPLGTGQRLHNYEEIDRSIPPLHVDNLRPTQRELGFAALEDRFTSIPVLHWNVTSQAHGCPALKEVEERAYKNTTLTELKDAMAKPYLSRIAAWTGISQERYAQDLEQVFTGAGLLECSYWQGIKIPNFNPDSDLKPMLKLVADSLYFGFNNIPDVALLRATPMYMSLKKVIEDSVEGKSPLKFVLFSGHDTDLAALMAGMKQPSLFPSFASTIFFDVYEKDGSVGSSSNWDNYYVKARFNDQELTFPSCSSHPCPAEEFQAFLSEIMLPNWKELCNAQTQSADLELGLILSLYDLLHAVIFQ